MFVFKIACLFALLTVAMAANPSTFEFKNVWHFSLDGCSFDPSEIKEPCYSRLMKSGVLAAILVVAGAAIAQIAGMSILAFGLVKLSYPLVLVISLAYYGYRANNKLFLVVGAVLSYLFAFGALTA